MYSKRTEITLGLWQEIVALGGPELHVSIFLLKSFGIDTCLWLLWIRCSLDAFLLMNIGPWKGMFPDFLSCCINHSFIYLLSFLHPRHFSFRYVIDDIFGIWNDVDFYFWPVGLCTWWSCFGLFWWWKVLSKILLKIRSIMIVYWAVDMCTFDFSRDSNTSSMVKQNLVGSWCLFVFCSDFLYSS